MFFSYCERLTELKAFFKSIWSTTSSDWPPLVLLYVIFDEWMTASEPPLTLIPNCRLSNSSTTSHLASLAKNFAMRRGNISLTAIGRTPLFFLDRAVSEVQQSALEKSRKVSPAAKVYKLCYRFHCKHRPTRCSAVYCVLEMFWKHFRGTGCSLLAECLQLFINYVFTELERIGCNFVGCNDAG